MNEKWNSLMKDLHGEYHEKLENLTLEQFKSAIHQAVISGDFMRHIIKQGTGYFHIDERSKEGTFTAISELQSVTYVPHRKVQELEMEVQRLKERIIEISPYGKKDAAIDEWD